VAEYTLGLMLALSRRLPEAATTLQEGRASHAELIGNDLAGRTLTIIGAGRIGRQVSRYAQVVGLTVLAVDPAPDPAVAAALGFTYVGLHDGLKRGDVISLHAPLTPDSRHLLNRHSLALLQPHALVINTARGELIDTTALLHALHTKTIGGAALDVIEGEELLDGQVEMTVLANGHVKPTVVREIAEHEALLKLPNVIMTNHNAYNSHQAHRRLTQGGVAVIRAYLADQPINIVK
jgi:D-lactate dehydrogenase